MATGFNGSGTFIRQQNWTNDANLGNPINATKFDEEGNGVAGAFNNCVTRDGQGKPSTDLTWTTALTLSKIGSTVLTTTGNVVMNAPTSGSVLATTGNVVLNAPASGSVLATTGNVVLNAPASGSVLTTTGNVTLNAPSSGPALALTGVLSGVAQSWANSGGTVSVTMFLDNTIVSFGTASATNFQIATNSTARFAIASAGNVTVNAPTSGTTLVLNGASASAPLVLNAAAASDGFNQLQRAGTAYGYFGLVNTAGNGFSSSLQNDVIIRADSGRVALGANAGGNAQFVCVAGTNSTVQAQDDGGTLQTVGWRDMPQNAQTGAYQLVLADRGKVIDYQGAGGSTLTIPANGTTSFPLGTTIGSVNGGAGSITLAITTDTLYWFQGNGTLTGGAGVSRTLTQYCVATIIKRAPTQWVITGVGVT
jgi:hypothetical protein